MHFATKNLSYEDVEKEIKDMKAAGYLITGRNEGMLTTSEAIQQEKEIITTMKHGQGATNQICSKTHVAERLKAWNSELNSSQRKAVELILCSKDMIVGVNGYAGTGKTYMLEKAKDIAASKGYELIGMAASASAASTLEKESGIKSQTIHKFLYKYKRLLDNTSNGVINHQYRFELRNKMLIVDEASLASTKQLRAICRIARELFVKVALIGDDKQLKAVEAGKPYQELQKYGMQTAIMNKIIRQKNPELKEAVYNSLNGAIDSAFKKIEKDIYEVQDKVKDKKDGIIKMASIHWVTLDDKKREKTLITAASNEIREGINNEIRKYLKFENKLKGEEYKHVILQNKNLTKSEKCFSGNYETNDVVLFNNQYKRLGIKAGEYLSVSAIAKNNLIILKNKHGRIIKWNPEYTGGNREGAIEIYQKKEIKLQQGDIIKWTKNSKENAAIINSESAKIISIDKNSIIVETAQKNKVSLNIKKDENILKHIDHGYASTVHNAQGKTYENVIGAIESKHPHLTNQPMFYVTLSRAKNQAILITDDKRQLSQTVKNNTGYRISALEHLAQKDKLELNQMNKNQVMKEETGVMKIEPAKFKMKL
jgi:ATP-dependent exoDNAse (exonuclease V) alpha subunit